jgi:hypothetical protein
VALAWADPAQGDVCPAGQAPWVRVAFAGDGFAPPALRARVIEQLGAEFRTHNVGLCEASGAPAEPAPLADIVLTLSTEAILSLEVRDAVTDKQIARELRLGSVPRDALALSITLAAEELVHASWIEAALAPPPAPAPAPVPQPVPAPVREVNRQEVAAMPEAPRATHGWMAEAAVMGAGEWAAGGQTDLGGDVRFMLGGRLAMSALAGLRLAPTVTSKNGIVHGSELLAGAGVSYSIVPRDARFGGDIGVLAELIDVQFSGTAFAPATGLSGSALGAVLSGTLGSWVRIGGPWRIVADATLGAPVLGVTAIDSNKVATGVSGVTIGLAIGVAATLPN